MIKKCIGCGSILQDKNKEDIGYTPNLKKSYCVRCFRLKHYGNDIKEIVEPYTILKRLNQKKGLVFFLLDYLNINKETINWFKSIKLDKVLVISKCDTLRKDMKYEKIKKWLKHTYNINEEIIFISGKNLKLSANIFKYLDERNIKTGFITGLTNAGKSTFINSLLKKNGINKEILVSNKENTTLDFISLKIGEYRLYDTPGFLYTTYDHSLTQKEIKPISFNITKPTTFIVNNNLKFHFPTDNQVIFYLTTNNIKRIYNVSSDLINETKMNDNTDFIIPGIGYFNVKQSTVIKTNMKPFEIRNDLSGEDYE